MARAPGVYLLHKPVGATSFAVLRSFLEGGPASPSKAPKACHGGALDPFADGLLLALVGGATHLFEHLHALPKTYEVELAWGRETDNGDLLGRVVAEAGTSHLTAGRIAEAAEAFVGWHEQVPPATSSKKIGGEPAYRKVHRGEEVTLPASRVYLHSVQWLAHTLPLTSRVRIVTRGGFYVRSFVRDLARALDTRAHVSALRRTRIGPWSDPVGEPVHVTGPAILEWLPTRTISDAELGQLRAEKVISARGVAPAAWRPPDHFPLVVRPDASAPATLRPSGLDLVGAIHLGRVRALLRQVDEGLALLHEFRGDL